MESITQYLAQLIKDTFTLLNPIIAIFVTVIICMIPFALLKRAENRAKKNDTPQDVKDIDVPEGQTEAIERPAVTDYPYVKPYLLTKNEWSFYRALRPITNKYQLHVLSKVRMADLVQVRSDVKGKEFQNAFDRIKSAHVDFVLANPTNLAVLCVIELDDSSHDAIDVQQNDYFKDQTFKTIGLPILRVKNAAGLEEQICKTLSIKQKQE